jgi:carbon-monoxide dehydrogenase medium subunit
VSARDAVVYCPATEREVLELLADRSADGKLVAGGTAFTVLWRTGLISAARLISCAAVAGLDHIEDHGDEIRIGALATFRAVELSPVVGERLPLLRAALAHVGNLRVRNVATWGGNLAEADNTSDLPAILVALDAVVVVRSVDGERVTSVADLIVDFFETTLRPEEMIVELRIPVPQARLAGCYVKFVARSAEDRTCLGVAACADIADDGTCRDVRVAAVGAATVPLRLRDVESAARGAHWDDDRITAIAAAYAEAADPLSDLRGTAEYRRRVLPGLVTEALHRAAGRDTCAVLL